jgi:hypothetical protein
MHAGGVLGRKFRGQGCGVAEGRVIEFPAAACRARSRGRAAGPAELLQPSAAAHSSNSLCRMIERWDPAALHSTDSEQQPL